MILSMTGFGEVLHEEDGRSYHIEIRCVNNRYFKSSLRLPEEFAFLETPLETLLRQKLQRGSITMRLYQRDLSASAAQDLNMAAIERYVAQLKSVGTQGPEVRIDLGMLATLPGVCQPHELTERERQHGEELVYKLTEQAIERVVEMRMVEGRALAEELRQHCDLIESRVTAIMQYVPGMMNSYRDRLKSRIEELLSGSNIQLAQDDLLKEVSIYAERSDVSEELSRLMSHLQQFREGLTSREAAGRKMDFIAQEMLREANTIGSKAGDAEVARHVIDIKGAIDRIKEQVQNIA
jgi:uncharacterized protein (TIGR00255 family)